MGGTWRRLTFDPVAMNRGLQEEMVALQEKVVTLQQEAANARNESMGHLQKIQEIEASHQREIELLKSHVESHTAALNSVRQLWCMHIGVVDPKNTNACPIHLIVSGSKEWPEYMGEYTRT